MKTLTTKLLMLFLVLGLTYSCVEPEELPACDPNKEKCDVVQDQGGDEPPADVEEEEEEVVDTTPPPAPVYSCSGKSFAYANLCAGDTANLSANGTFSLADSCTDALKCEFVCKEGYEPNADHSACQVIVPVVYNCSGSSIPNGNLCAGDNNDLTANGSFSLVSACTDAKKCEYVCNSGYKPNAGFTACEPIEPTDETPSIYKCSGNSYDNGILCDGDSNGLAADDTFSLVSACTDAKKCEYVCNDGYEPNADNTACIEKVVAPPVVYSCSGSSFPFATLCNGDTDGLAADEVFNLAASCSEAKKCEFVCNSGFEPNAGMTSCVEIVVTPPNPEDEIAPPIASKNYLQINNSFSTMTGVPTDHPEVLAEFNAIIMQLPSTSNPEALNGFNQIAQTRLGFAYCSVYMDNNFTSQYGSLTNNQIANKLLDSFVDVDYNSNPAHIALKQNLLDILSDLDNLVVDNNATNKKRKLSKMACGALLASAYVTMM